MKKYSTEELKVVWLKLYYEESIIWLEANMELARRLSKKEYSDFVSNNKTKTNIKGAVENV